MLDPAEITFNMIFRLNVIVFLLHSRMSMKCSMNFNLNPFLTNTVWKVSVFRVFLVRISPHSDWIRRGTPYLCSIFSPNVGKYGPEKLRIRTIFTLWSILSCSVKPSLSLRSKTNWCQRKTRNFLVKQTQMSTYCARSNNIRRNYVGGLHCEFSVTNLRKY